jgi:signal transduction histidine kinase
MCTPADGTAEVQGDRQKLASLIGNLLDNAARYAPDGSAVDVVLREERGAVTLEVCDEGPGIPEELRARVFESYYRIPGSTGGGSGLGLAIVREVARAHGARVEVRAGRGGKGTAVVVTFPK